MQSNHRPDCATAQKPPIVLIHGAWQGSWVFSTWAPFLERQQWQVHAVDLPGNGHSTDHFRPATLQGYTDHVLALLETLDAPAVIAGHSGGGITATQVAEAAPERVRALVYLAGMMLPSSMSFRDLVRDAEQTTPGFDFSGIGPHLIWNDTRTQSCVPAEAAMALFLQDCDQDAARAAAGRLTPQTETGRAMHNQFSAPRHGQVPRIYVECTQDRSIALPLQRSMQELSPGAARVTLDCGHVPQLARPALLTERLMPLLNAIPLHRSFSTALA